jgi:RHS repeat-associated protein
MSIPPCGRSGLLADDAYGNPLTFTPANALTSLLYTGEQFDQRIAMQYLRARYYNPATGTFNRLDPFAGNMQDPQSLHKYLYVHGDPIQGVDPSGLMSLSVSLSSMSLRGGLIGAAIGTGAGYAYGVYVTGEWFFVVHLKHMLIGGLAGFAIGATTGAYIGYATNAARGLSSGGALHNFVKIADKLWTVPRAIRAGTLGATKGKIFASFALGAAAGAWAAAIEEDPYEIGLLGSIGTVGLATETATSVAYHHFLHELLRKKLGKFAAYLSGTGDIVISFTIGFNVGYMLNKGVQIGTAEIIRALEDNN